MNKHFLTLVRHAKSSWQNAGQADHDRALNNRGNRDAPVMAERLAARGCIPDLILCSSARRTQETAAYFVKVFNFNEDYLWIEPKLYLPSPESILREVAAAAGDFKHVMVIAHNPGLEQLSSMLCSACTPAMPTLGIRHFSTPSLDSLHLHSNDHRVESDERAAADSDESVQLLFEDFPKNSE